MADIRVETIGDNIFGVTVTNGAGQSQHRVTVAPAFYQSYQAGASSPERLLTAAFEFLLEREPKESIMREFDVPVISRYFPEFEDELRRRLIA